MRLSTLVLSLVAVAGLAAAGGFVWRIHQRSVEWKKLLHYSRRNGCLPAEQWEEYHRIGRRSVPDEADSCGVDRIIATGAPGPNGRILILVSDPGRPDEVRVHCLDENRHLRGRTTLPGGTPGGTLEWAGVSDLGDLLPDYFVLEESKCRYHYYALSGDGPVLILTGDVYGKVPENNYVHSGYRIGPPLPGDALGRCEAMLMSSNPIDVLQALVWLHGRHPEGSGWSELRKRPSVQRRIEELAKSPTRAYREAAGALLPSEKTVSPADR